MTPSLSFLSPVALRDVTVRSKVGVQQMVAATSTTLTKLGTNGVHDRGADTDSITDMDTATVGFVGPKKEGLRVVELYDTTLRDGTQMEGISASVNDKLKIAKELHNFGMSSTEFDGLGRLAVKVFSPHNSVTVVVRL